ncbi:hypothetical protein [Oceanicella actignis]|uniref:hypothetical protein n=1 Tax=Oceanicella actignis TaxID=1189325 RepID=UPI0011E86747|nr:hypothetical protein [Oceanicella actignis]TYO91450.1 hypothetical protein LY05_00303 [Oceanicella actignis]
MSWTAIDTSDQAERLRRLIRDAADASTAHANLMREYRITSSERRAEMFALLASELIAWEMRAREEGRR